MGALRRYAAIHGPVIDRQTLLREQLARILAETGSRGRTPDYTLSRELQELRDDGLLLFVAPGRYLLVDGALDIETLDLPGHTVDEGLKAGRLRLGQVPVHDAAAQRRLRLGQDRLRRLTLQNYRFTCAVCDVTEEELLVASHIARWADCPTGRGDLTNLLCLCRFHDPLFELGYFTLSDDLQVIRRYSGPSLMVDTILHSTGNFHHPLGYPPHVKYLTMHRARTA